MHQRILKSGIIICGLVAFGLAMTALPTESSIAAFTSYHAPKLRIDKSYSLKDQRRFHPNPRHYSRKTLITIHRREPLIERRIGNHQFRLGSRPIIKHVMINTHLNYKLKKVDHAKMCYLHPNFPIWPEPYRPGMRYVSSTTALAHVKQGIILQRRATAKHHTFYQIKSGGHIYGWVTRKALKHSSIYQMPFRYYSQLKPYYAPDACEVVSLRMALSVKGHDPKMSMRNYIKRVPRNHNPNKGYNHDPLVANDNAAIFPQALTKYGRRYYNRTYNFTGMNKKSLIKQLEEGNPVVFEGSYRMYDSDSDHTLVLVGYSSSDHEVKFADPYYDKEAHKPISWVSMHKLEKIVHREIRGARAVVLK